MNFIDKQDRALFQVPILTSVLDDSRDVFFASRYGADFDKFGVDFFGDNSR